MQDGINPDQGNDDARPDPVEEDYPLGALLMAEEDDVFTSKPAEASDENGNDDQATDDDGQDAADADDPDAIDAAPEEEPEETPAPTVIEDDTAKVRLADGTETTLADLKRGFMQQGDYTQKSQANAEFKRELEGQRESVTQLEQTLSQEREQLATVLQAFMPERPDPAMIDDDPIGYQKAVANYEQTAGYLQHVMGQQEQAQQRQREAQQQDHAKFLQEQRDRAHELMPELRDDARRKEFAEQASTVFAPTYGFTVEELSGLTDPRYMPVIRDALAYQQVKARQKQAVAQTKNKPPMLKAGQRRSANQPSKNASAQIARAQKSGNIDDAAGLLGALLEG